MVNSDVASGYIIEQAILGTINLIFLIATLHQFVVERRLNAQWQLIMRDNDNTASRGPHVHIVVSPVGSSPRPVKPFHASTHAQAHNIAADRQSGKFPTNIRRMALLCSTLMVHLTPHPSPLNALIVPLFLFLLALIAAWMCRLSYR